MAKKMFRGPGRIGNWSSETLKSIRKMITLDFSPYKYETIYVVPPLEREIIIGSFRSGVGRKEVKEYKYIDELARALDKHRKAQEELDKHREFYREVLKYINTVKGFLNPVDESAIDAYVEKRI